MNFNVDWWEHLHKEGWAVVEIENWKAEFVDRFFDWFESCSSESGDSSSSGFKRDDPETWKNKQMPSMIHGILKHYFGHTEFQWQIRELCGPIFSKIWKTPVEDLLCSFDGGCFMPAVLKEELLKSKSKQWYHHDTTRDFPGFCCVQGVVNFVENGFEDGGLVLLEGSKHVYNEYMEKHPTYGFVWQPCDMSDPLLSNLKHIKICAPAGHLILWDGRMIHCNVAPWSNDGNDKGRYRMATYVSMQPRVSATTSELEKRKNWYKTGRMTGHWCYGPYLQSNSENPRTYGQSGPIVKPSTIEIAELNPLRKSLIGY